MKTLTIPTAEPFFFPGGKTGCVLVHGFTGTPKEMRLMGNFLNENGITVIGIRLAGHATQITDMVRTRWRDWLTSVEDGINLLSNLCDHIFIAGLSMGGILALMAASQSICAIDGVIAMSTPYIISNDWRVKFAKQVSLLLPYIKKEQSETIDQNTSKDHIDYPAYPTRSIAELNKLTETLHGNLERIHIPILLINSRNDKTAPPSHAENYRHDIPSNDIKLVILKKSGHVITEDIEREIVFNAALSFICKYSKQ
ncbi:MAG: alpha/beta fold hydrolase [Anaerolineaceae bacterium]|nr:alpha/beta fold hydrolase [Anaerolineaceae bacterium]